MNETKIINIRRIETKLSRRLNFKNNRYDEINTYRNKRIKFNFKRVPQSRVRRQISFNDILFQKIIFNNIKL